MIESERTASRWSGEPWADVAETHSAAVFFAGDRAWKLKKPVSLDFLDFSTPQARAAACRHETELNARFAPDVYLGVAEVRDRLGFTVLDSDRIRKELAGLPAETSARAPYLTGIYSPAWTERAYAELLHRATALLAHGESVVADASFISASQRAAAATVAAAVSADLVQLRCIASRELAAQRLSARPPGTSDADEAIAAQLEAAAQPWPDATVIDTETSGTGGVASEFVRQALDAIRPHGPQHVWRPTRPYMLPG